MGGQTDGMVWDAWRVGWTVGVLDFTLTVQHGSHCNCIVHSRPAPSDQATLVLAFPRFSVGRLPRLSVYSG